MSVNFKNNVSNVPKGKSSSNFGMLHPAKFNQYFNEFHEFNADDFEVVKVEGGSGAATTNIIDGDGGILRLVTDNADDDCVCLLLGDGNAFKGSMRFNFDKDWFFKIRCAVSGFSGGNDFVFKAGISWDLPTGADMIDFIPGISCFINAPFGILPFDGYFQAQTNNAAGENSSVGLNMSPPNATEYQGPNPSPVNLTAGAYNTFEMYYDSKKKFIKIACNGQPCPGVKVGYRTESVTDQRQPINTRMTNNMFQPPYTLQGQRWPDPTAGNTNDATKYMSPFISIRNQQAGATKTLDIDYIWCGVEREGAEDLVL